ncbi:carboxymuconolactone decarboxylase family protein [Enterovirga rhinocerotis]|uniref:4-carboxymuconolactone decarboxylase n=1 Tax=Enterovirga rhinocerotis TaxID=1339210 RepID=A0A4R7BHD0_9HYPH|nr:carboxymuconolactone decarboxylase family protein [Enterovirga rhinocerotis]TDR84511.1 4-carboxymuconolactone decarboxylase [Enterovirga rhinocerotis]
MKRDIGRRLLMKIIGQEYFTCRDASTNSFNQDLRRLSEEYCFGEIWSRPGLPPSTRSLLCIGMLAALGKTSELRLHVGGALNNGCSVDEIKEILLQATIYCGLPTGVEATRIAEEVLKERGITFDAVAVPQGA